MREARRSRSAGSVVRPWPVRSDSASTAGRSSRATGRTKNTGSGERAVEGRLEPREALEDLVEPDHERRREPHDVRARDQHEQAGLAGRLHDVHRLALPRDVELGAEPDALAAQL